MAKNIRTLVAALVIPFALSAGVASASDYDYTSKCDAQFTDVDTAIDQPGAYFSKNADANRINLLTKLAGADSKMNDGKPTEASDLLLQISERAIVLSTPDAKGKVKLDPGVAGQIVEKVNLAMPCAI